jgi:SAM-dependent MidA family methyltransferase
VTESPPLAIRLAKRIRLEGPMRFDVFQEAALYDPDGGYYERSGRVGRGGDFVTGPSWHPAFGRAMARIARRLKDEEEDKISANQGKKEKEETSEKGGEKGKEGEISSKGEESAPRSLFRPTDIVDVGAGEGELLAAADEALRSWGVREQFRLTGIERSAARRSVAAARCPSATWLSSFEEIPKTPGLRGLVVAYELFDALPVRALSFDGEKLLERVVTLGPDPDGVSFEWDVAECADGAALLQGFRTRGIHLQRDQKLEVRSGATRLAAALGEHLSQGLLLVFDYGAPARALYSPARSNGTLEAFHEHSVSRDVLADPGGRDLTAWVDFTEIGVALEAEGLAVAGPVSQARVLSSAGIGAELEADSAATPTALEAAERNAIARLVAPGGMGESIRVLLGSRDSGVKEALLAWPSPAASG